MSALILLFRALPIVWQLAGIGVVIGGVGGAYLYWHHKIYERGYDDAMADTAAQNAKAAEDVKKQLSKTRACRDGGGSWSSARGVCDQP